MCLTDKDPSVVPRCANARAGITLLLVALLLSSCGGKQMKNRKASARKGPAVDAIRVHDELNRLQKLVADGSETEENIDSYKDALGSLVLASQRDALGFTRELIDFEVAAEKAHNEKAGMIAALVRHISTASNQEIVQALQPYFEKSDAATQAVVSEFLFHVERASGTPDFSYYPLSDDSASGLAIVEHMFRRSPGQALQTFAMAVFQDERRKPLLWARHIVDDALWKRQYGFDPAKGPDAAVTEQLEKMAGRDEYWARLYAAEVIRQHPEFGTNELATRLKMDPHPLVHKAADAIRSATR